MRVVTGVAESYAGEVMPGLRQYNNLFFFTIHDTWSTFMTGNAAGATMKYKYCTTSDGYMGLLTWVVFAPLRE